MALSARPPGRRLLAMLAFTLVAGSPAQARDGFADLLAPRGPGAPLGLVVRTQTHVATLLRQLEPQLPSLHRDGSRDRHAISLLLVPLDGSEPSVVPIARRLSHNQFVLGRILGSDGRRLWYQVDGLGAVDLATRRAGPVPGPAPTDLQGAVTSPFPPRPDVHLAAGWITAPGSWLGLHADEELALDMRPGKFLRRVVAQRTRDTTGAGVAARRLHVATLDPPLEGRYHRIRTTRPVGEERFLDGAFLRLDGTSEPLLLSDPAGALMLHMSAPGLLGTAVVARVDATGQVRWRSDTGIDRFTLQQILPGETSFVFVGTRPRVPDRVPEPLIVIVDNATGRTTVRSMWR